MGIPRRRPRISEMSVYNAQGSRKYLTESERRRFLNALHGLEMYERLFCLVAVWSGGRISEVLSLTAASFDLDAGTVAIVTLKRRSRRVVRQVLLPPDLFKSLTKNLKLRSRQRDPWLAGQRLWPWSRVTGWRWIKRAMGRAHIEGPAASPKGLRHTFGVRAFETNVPPHLVQRWLGHASLRTTAIYGDVVGREERKFARRMWR